MAFKAKNTKVRMVLLAAALISPLMMSGCSMVTPTNVTSNKAQVHIEDYALEMPTDEIGNKELDVIGEHYRTYGDGIAHVTVTYDPHSRVNSARNARESLSRIRASLTRSGLKSIAVDVLPVRDQGDRSMTYISYNKIYATAPKDCSPMPSLNSADTNALRDDYKLGCATEDYFIRQLARPADLLGREGLDVSDGRRNAIINEPYRNGEGYGALSGESASQ